MTAVCRDEDLDAAAADERHGDGLEVRGGVGSEIDADVEDLTGNAGDELGVGGDVNAPEGGLDGDGVVGLADGEEVVVSPIEFLEEAPGVLVDVSVDDEAVPDVGFVHVGHDEGPSVPTDRIAYIQAKSVGWSNIQGYLGNSIRTNHWANFGPAVQRLEERLEEYLDIPEDCGVVTFSSGTTALHGLVELLGRAYGKPWAVSSFGFYCTKLGPLADSVVIDCDARGMLNTAKIPDPCEIGGLVVTNTFGLYDLKPYADYCKQWGLNLICDSATAFDAKHFPNSIISFHHTKPWGFGEGGCAIVRKEHKDVLKAYTNFGVLGRKKVLDFGTNAKMSDWAAAAILNRLDELEDVRTESKAQYARIVDLAKRAGYVPMAVAHPGFPSNVPLVAPKPVPDEALWGLDIPIRKYYIPLAPTPTATFLYDRILNFPCHPGLAQASDDHISQVLQGLIE